MNDGVYSPTFDTTQRYTELRKLAGQVKRFSTWSYTAVWIALAIGFLLALFTWGTSLVTALAVAGELFLQAVLLSVIAEVLQLFMDVEEHAREIRNHLQAAGAQVQQRQPSRPEVYVRHVDQPPSEAVEGPYGGVPVRLTGSMPSPEAVADPAPGVGQRTPGPRVFPKPGMV